MTAMHLALTQVNLVNFEGTSQTSHSVSLDHRLYPNRRRRFMHLTMWTLIPQNYGNHSPSFPNKLSHFRTSFKLCIGCTLPGSGQERQWLVVDIERLVEERSCVDIRSLSDFGDYLQRSAHSYNVNSDFP